MNARERVAHGMTVYTRDGEKLGKVVAADDIGLFVEKGLFFPKEYGFRYDDVEDVRDDGVHLCLDKEAISRTAAHGSGLERSRPSAVSEDRERRRTPEGLAPGTSSSMAPERGVGAGTSSGEVRGVTGEASGVGSGEAGDVDRPAHRRAEGLTVPMVGEGIAPMLVEEEVVVVREVPPAGGERRTAPADEARRTASEAETRESSPDARKGPGRG